MTKQISRRTVLKGVAATSVVGVWSSVAASTRAADSPNEKLNIAYVGCGGRASANFQGSENTVALCDVDTQRAGKRWEQYPKAKQYFDFRKMLDEMHKEIDAVVISTPDHTHFHPARAAMLLGKHVYLEKPMAHSAWECRELTKIAEKMKVATQLGNQRHAHSGMRKTAECIQQGVIGKVKEVYAFMGGSRGMPKMPTEFPKVPEHLKWDLWLGPAQDRPYSPDYCPYKWRFWWDFGTGETGNWGCHILDIPFWALGLKYPNKVGLDEIPLKSEIDAQRTPKKMLTRLEFPKEAGHDAVTLHWWHGGPRNEIFKKYGRGVKEGMVLFIGDKGTLSCGFDNPTIKMDDGSEPKQVEDNLRKSPGFHKEWLISAKGGERATCDFVDYTGPLAESVLLANAAFRSGGGFDWDAKAFKASGNKNIDEFIFPKFRKGWEVDGI